MLSAHSNDTFSQSRSRDRAALPIFIALGKSVVPDNRTELDEELNDSRDNVSKPGITTESGGSVTPHDSKTTPDDVTSADVTTNETQPVEPTPPVELPAGTVFRPPTFPSIWDDLLTMLFRPAAGGGELCAKVGLVRFDGSEDMKAKGCTIVVQAEPTSSQRSRNLAFTVEVDLTTKGTYRVTCDDARFPQLCSAQEVDVSDPVMISLMSSYLDGTSKALRGFNAGPVRNYFQRYANRWKNAVASNCNGVYFNWEGNVDRVSYQIRHHYARGHSLAGKVADTSTALYKGGLIPAYTDVPETAPASPHADEKTKKNEAVDEEDDGFDDIDDDVDFVLEENKDQKKDVPEEEATKDGQLDEFGEEVADVELDNMEMQKKDMEQKKQQEQTAVPDPQEGEDFDDVDASLRPTFDQSFMDGFFCDFVPSVPMDMIKFIKDAGYDWKHAVPHQNVTGVSFFQPVAWAYPENYRISCVTHQATKNINIAITRELVRVLDSDANKMPYGRLPYSKVIPEYSIVFEQTDSRGRLTQTKLPVYKENESLNESFGGYFDAWNKNVDPLSDTLFKIMKHATNESFILDYLPLECSQEDDVKFGTDDVLMMATESRKKEKVSIQHIISQQLSYNRKERKRNQAMVLAAEEKASSEANGTPLVKVNIPELDLLTPFELQPPSAMSGIMSSISNGFGGLADFFGF